MLIKCLCVGLGGFVGAVFRYLLSLIPISAAFPIMTMVINVLGSLVIGVIYALTGQFTNINPLLLLLFQTGVCGGFTTFSTFSLESLQLLENGRIGLLALYIAASIILCIGAVWLGKQGATALFR